AVTVGDARHQFTQQIAKLADAIRVGNGLDKDVQMGPVITAESKKRIEGLITAGVHDGAKVLLDGRGGNGSASPAGNFLKPTLLDGVPGASGALNNEIFGAELSARGYTGRRDRDAFAKPLWKYGVDFHQQRRRG